MKRAVLLVLLGCHSSGSFEPPTAAGDDGGPPSVIGDDDAGACEAKCSSDLHGFVDCHGTTVKTCPDDQGCTPDGQCVAACDSAKINKSTIGCDYFSVNPDTTFAAGACFAAFVTNTWSSPVDITVEFGGQKLDPSGFARIPKGTGKNITYAALPNGQLPPGEIAILFLAQFGTQKIYKPACPIAPAITDADVAPHDTSIASAFHIGTSAPVAAYDVFPYGGGISAITSATLLLPTSAWDKNYVAVDPWGTDMAQSRGSWPFIDIVATEDGTNVTISPSAAIVGGTNVPATGKGQPHAYALSRGQVLHLVQPEELAGSPILADKPVGLWGGNGCFQYPANAPACDSSHQQIPPVNALGHEYAGVRHRDRNPNKSEPTPWRFVGLVDGTVLTYEPSTPPGAPLSLSLGEVQNFTFGGAFIVHSQDDKHPFYAGAYMTGAQTVNDSLDGRGDPEFVNLVPTAQWLHGYTFFTDPTYPETNLVVVRSRGGKDVSLDCLKSPIAGWQPVGAKYEYARVDLVTGNFQGQNGCDNGRHVMKSDGAFALTVWGWGSAITGGATDPNTNQGGGFYTQYVSYAYPAGASVLPINSVTVPPTPH